MYDILTPSIWDLFTDWFINFFNEEDRGDDHVVTENDDDDSDKSDEDKSDDNKDEEKEEPSEEEPDDEEKEEDYGKTKGHMIPKHRYDNAAARANTAEARNAELEEENATLRGTPESSKDSPSIDDQISDLDKQIEEARADNKIDDVIRLSKDQRILEKEQFQTMATDTSTVAGKQAREQIKFDDVVDHLEATHSFLNKDADDFDQDLINDILAMQVGLVESGRTPAAAMTRAADLLIPKPDKGNKDVGDTKKTDIKKNLDAANKQAPDTTGKGESSDKGGDLTEAGQLDAMTQEEFDAIPEETKKRLRGDSF